jgi:hypothetical protein
MEGVELDVRLSVVRKWIFFQISLVLNDKSMTVADIIRCWTGQQGKNDVRSSTRNRLQHSLNFTPRMHVKPENAQIIIEAVMLKIRKRAQVRDSWKQDVRLAVQARSR